jgi:hypothetical protein
MAPEAYQPDQPVGPAADIFSFGVLARKQFHADPEVHPVPLGQRLLASAPLDLLPVQAACPGVPPGLGRMLDDCLRLDPSARPTAAALVEAFATMPIGTKLEPELELKPELERELKPELAPEPRGPTN